MKHKKRTFREQMDKKELLKWRKQKKAVIVDMKKEQKIFEKGKIHSEH